MKYAGLCIGGPLDGQSLVSHTTQHRVQERPSMGGPLSVRETNREAKIMLKTVSYGWYAIPGMGIWIPEGTTVEQAVNTLATLYANTVTR